MSLDPLSDLEGFDDDARRWCPRPMKGAEAAAVALGTTVEDKAEVSPQAEVVVAATRRIDEGIMVALAQIHASIRAV